MILRGEHGVTRLAACMADNGICKPESIELLAILKELQICSAMGINKLILESDYLLMVKEYLYGGSSLSELGIIVTEIKRIQAMFEDCKLQHVYKEQDRPAPYSC